MTAGEFSTIRRALKSHREEIGWAMFEIEQRHAIILARRKKAVSEFENLTRGGDVKSCVLVVQQLFVLPGCNGVDVDAEVVGGATPGVEVAGNLE